SLAGRIRLEDRAHGRRDDPMRLARESMAVAAKDLRIEIRGRYAAGTVLPFAATLLIAFGLSIGPGRTLLRETAPGLLWLAVMFLGKALAVAVQLLALEAVVVVLVSALFDVSFARDAGVTAAAFALGTIGLAAVGSLFGVLTESARAREAVFPLLVLPLTVPVLIAGVKATAIATTGSGGGVGGWLSLLAAFDVVFVAAGTLVFGSLLGD